MNKKSCFNIYQTAKICGLIKTQPQPREQILDASNGVNSQ
jgi:hypothetical protein